MVFDREIVWIFHMCDINAEPSGKGLIEVYIMNVTCNPAVSLLTAGILFIVFLQG